MAQLDKFKLSALSWDSDKDPKGFYIWIENMVSLVQSIDYGTFLENMLDSKLGRTTISPQTVPSFLLNDPDFAPAFMQPAQPDPMQPTNTTASVSSGAAPSEVPPSAPSAPLPSGMSGLSSVSGHFSLGQHTIKYSDFPDEARELD